MNQLTPSSSSGAASTPGEQRLSTQLDRQQWDAEWIAGQRSTSEVIRGDDRQRDIQTRVLTKLEHAPAEAQRSYPEHLEHRDPHSRAEVGTEGPGLSHKSVPQVPALQTLQVNESGGLPPQMQITPTGAMPSEEHSVALTGSRTPTELRQFAMWREDDAVRITMRLRDPERAATGILAVLRGWLREAGLRLAQVTVNGRAQGEPPSRLNTRI